MLKNNLCIIIIFVFFALSCSVLDFPQEIREAKHISNFTRDGDFLYFGAGYKLFRLNPSQQTVETVFTTDRVLIEQSLIADNTLYFGGISQTDNRGNRGEYAGLFAIDLQSQKLK